MAKLEFFLALKFLLNIKSEKSISTMIKICFISILVSSFALTLICAIMNGFEKETYKKLKGVHSDIIINSRSQEINFDRLKPVLFKEFGVYIKAASPFSIGQAILRSQNKNNKFHSLVMLKAVDPKSEFLVNNLDDMLLSTYKDQKDWNLLLKNKNIFIGETLAKNLHVNISDKIDLLYPDEDIEDNRILLHVEPVKIAGIFKTGMQELDEQVIMSSLNFFQDIFGHGPTGVNIKLKKEFKENDDILNKLRKRFKLDIFSWKDLYPAIVSALALEKAAMIAILSLITLLALINIMALIFMLIIQKKKDIAILKFSGMSNNSIRLIFIYISSFITGIASFIGIFIAWIISYLLEHYKLIRIPDAYYVSYLPASMNLKIATIIFFSIIITSFIISVIPIRKIKDIDIAQILKSEF